MNYELKFLEHTCSFDYETNHIELLDDLLFQTKLGSDGYSAKDLYHLVDIGHDLYLIKTISARSGVFKAFLPIIEEDIRAYPAAGEYIRPYFHEHDIFEFLQINLGFSFSHFSVFEITDSGQRISTEHYNENKEDIMESLNFTTLESYYENNIYAGNLKSVKNFSKEYVSYFFETPKVLNPGEIGFLETSTIVSLGKFDFDLEVFFQEKLLRKYRLPKKTGNYHLYLKLTNTVFKLRFPLQLNFQKLIDQINDGNIKLTGILLSKEKLKTRLNRSLSLKDNLDEMRELEFLSDDFDHLLDFSIKSTIGKYSLGTPDRVNIIKK